MFPRISNPFGSVFGYDGDSTGDLEFNNGLGIKINGSGTFQIGTGLLSTVGNVNVGGDLEVSSDVQVNGGDITTNQSTFNIANTTATTIISNNHIARITFKNTILIICICI